MCIRDRKNTETLRHCYICHRKDLYLTRYMKDFIDILLEVENPFLKDSPLPKDQAQDCGQQDGLRHA